LLPPFLIAKNKIKKVRDNNKSTAYNVLVDRKPYNAIPKKTIPKHKQKYLKNFIKIPPKPIVKESDQNS
jgi:hypothetical protein